MKKARIFLSAIAVMALVAGAFAFKPSKFSLYDVYCPIIENGIKKCPVVPERTFSQTPTQVPNFKCPINALNPLGQVFVGFTTTTTTLDVICTGTTTSTVYSTLNQ